MLEYLTLSIEIGFAVVISGEAVVSYDDAGHCGDGEGGDLGVVHGLFLGCSWGSL